MQTITGDELYKLVWLEPITKIAPRVRAFGRRARALPGRYEKGHLFEFLGHQEKNASLRHQAERERNSWSENEQRTAHATAIQTDVQGLRDITSTYGG